MTEQIPENPLNQESTYTAVQTPRSLCLTLMQSFEEIVKLAHYQSSGIRLQYWSPISNDWEDGPMETIESALTLAWRVKPGQVKFRAKVRKDVAVSASAEALGDTST